MDRQSLNLGMEALDDASGGTKRQRRRTVSPRRLTADQQKIADDLGHRLGRRPSTFEIEEAMKNLQEPSHH